MKSLFLLCLLSVFYGTAESAIKEYFYVRHSKSWTAAQRYCRRNYGDLAAVTGEDEIQAVAERVGQASFWVWIGLNGTVPHQNVWRWSDGEKSDFTKWFGSEPDDLRSPGENCVVMDANGWYDDVCEEKHRFVCSSSFVLAKEKKTWEEALRHCATRYSRLVATDSPTLPDRLKTETGRERTVGVWTGLRFLDGEWFKADGASTEGPVPLPPCPLPPFHCGAFNFSTYVWENRDCNEKLDFFRYH